MKILWLGTSNDTEGYLPKEQRRPFMVARDLADILGTEIQVESRKIWPSAILPQLVESWMEKHEPDMVLLQIANFSFAYESVPLQLERKLGVFGRPFASAGLKAADTGWLSSNRVFHAGRRLAQRTIGGATHFEPDEVVERISACIRVVLRRENTALLVRGPQGSTDYSATEKRRLRAEARRLVVNKGLRDICDELHVVCALYDVPRYEARTGERVGDGIHFQGSENVVEAAVIVPQLVKAWAQLHPEFEAAAAEA